jgi:hypothetical protein
MKYYPTNQSDSGGEEDVWNDIFGRKYNPRDIPMAFANHL